MSIPNGVHHPNGRRDDQSQGMSPAPSKLIQDLGVMANPRFDICISMSRRFAASQLISDYALTDGTSAKARQALSRRPAASAASAVGRRPATHCPGHD